MGVLPPGRMDAAGRVVKADYMGAVAVLADCKIVGVFTERDLLAALADGQTNAQIAKALSISLNTVKFHLKNLYEKLGVSNRSQAIAIYLKS